MRAWDRFWSRFDELMGSIDEVVEEAIRDPAPGMVVTTMTNGHVEVVGDLKSLSINGYTVRVPSYVMRKR